MTEDKQLNGANDLDTHDLLYLKQVPDSIVALRLELAKPENADITAAAIRESTFEGSLATIAEKLDIVVDGIYDVGPLCAMLTTAMRQRHLAPSLRFKGITGLQEGAELVETADAITLEVNQETVDVKPIVSN